MPNFVPKLEVKMEAPENSVLPECIKPDSRMIKQENPSGLYLSTDLQTPIYSLVPTIKVEPEDESLIEFEFMNAGSSCEENFAETTISCEASSTAVVLRENLLSPISEILVPNFVVHSNIANEMTECESIVPGTANKSCDIERTGLSCISVPGFNELIPNAVDYSKTVKTKESDNYSESVLNGSPNCVSRSDSCQKEPILNESSAWSSNSMSLSFESLIENTIIAALSNDRASPEAMNGNSNLPILPVRDSQTPIYFDLEQHSISSAGAKMHVAERHKVNLSEPASKKHRGATSDNRRQITKSKATVRDSTLFKITQHIKKGSRKSQTKQTPQPVRTGFDILNYCMEKQPIEGLSARLHAEAQRSNLLNPMEARQSLKPTFGNSCISSIINEYYPTASNIGSKVLENHRKPSSASIESLILNTVVESLNCDKISCNTDISSQINETSFSDFLDPFDMNFLNPTERISELVTDSVIVLKPTNTHESTINLNKKQHNTKKTYLPPEEQVEAAQNSMLFSVSTQNVEKPNLNSYIENGITELMGESSKIIKYASKQKADYYSNASEINQQDLSVHSNPSVSTEPILKSVKNCAPFNKLIDKAKLVVQAKIDPQAAKQIPRISPEIKMIDVTGDSIEPNDEETLPTSRGVPKPIVLSEKMILEKSGSCIERRENDSSIEDNMEAESEEHARLEMLQKFSKGNLSEDEKANVIVMPVKLSSSPQSMKQTTCLDLFHFIQGTGWACDKCGRLYEKTQDLREHKIHEHYRLDEFICPECQAIFNSQVSLENHCKTCQPVYKCPKCPKLCRSLLLYERHYVLHHENAYICVDCLPLKGFKSKSRLIDHMSQKHLDASIPCKACGKMPRNSRNVHDRKNFQCHYCEKHFTDKVTLKEHLKTHSSGNTAYLCQYCGESFELKPDYLEHLKEHENEKRFL